MKKRLLILSISLAISTAYAQMPDAEEILKEAQKYQGAWGYLPPDPTGQNKIYRTSTKEFRITHTTKVQLLETLGSNCYLFSAIDPHKSPEEGRNILGEFIYGSLPVTIESAN